MALRDFIKAKMNYDSDDELFIEKAVKVFEKNTELYKGKSLAWNIRISADELNIRKDELLELLDKHYGTQETAEE